jgi:protein YIPF1/2
MQIATTLVFCIAVVSHFSSYVYSILNSKATWSYDFQSILNVASVVYSFVALVPAGLWFIMKQYVTTDVREINLVTAMCVYGYSLLFFIPAVVSSHKLSRQSPYTACYLLSFVC